MMLGIDGFDYNGFVQTVGKYLEPIDLYSWSRTCHTMNNIIRKKFPTFKVELTDEQKAFLQEGIVIKYPKQDFVTMLYCTKVQIFSEYTARDSIRYSSHQNDRNKTFINHVNLPNFIAYMENKFAENRTIRFSNYTDTEMTEFQDFPSITMILSGTISFLSQMKKYNPNTVISQSQSGIIHIHYL